MTVRTHGNDEIERGCAKWIGRQGNKKEASNMSLKLNKDFVAKSYHLISSRIEKHSINLNKKLLHSTRSQKGGQHVPSPLQPRNRAVFDPGVLGRINISISRGKIQI
jgi:hypothetical protein